LNSVDKAVSTNLINGFIVQYTLLKGKKKTALFNKKSLLENDLQVADNNARAMFYKTALSDTQTFFSIFTDVLLRPNLKIFIVFFVFFRPIDRFFLHKE